MLTMVLEMSGLVGSLSFLLHRQDPKWDLKFDTQNDGVMLTMVLKMSGFGASSWKDVSRLLMMAWYRSQKWSHTLRCLKCVLWSFPSESI